LDYFTAVNYLENLQYLPCSCEVCQAYTATELKQLDQEIRTSLLAKHNLIVSLEEIRRIKQAIIEGRLYELVLSRVMNHPSLAKVLDLLFGSTTSEFIEQYEPISKSRSLLITHPILSFHPILLRYRKRMLERFYIWNQTLIIGQDFQNLHSSGSYQVIRLSPIFGIVPDELQGIYPLIQHERIPMSFSSEISNFISQFLQKYKSKCKRIKIHPSLDLNFKILQDIDIFERTINKNKLNETHIVNAIIDYQFGAGTHTILSDQSLIIERSRKS